MDKSLTYLVEVETVAQDLLTARHEKLELSNAKNKFNEAARVLDKSDTKSVLIDFDRTLFQFPRKVALGLIKEDMQEASDEINRLHEKIKRKASELRDIEHQPKIIGIGLKPLSAAEAKAIHKAFGAE